MDTLAHHAINLDVDFCLVGGCIGDIVPLVTSSQRHSFFNSVN